MNNEKYKRQDRTFWESQIEAWQHSGMSQTDFCRENDITLSSFCNWKSKLTKSTITRSEFVECAQPVKFYEDYIEFIFDDGSTIKISDRVSPEALQAVCYALRGL